MKDIIVMCPTLQRARYEFNQFCRFYDSLIDNKKLYKIKLKDGRLITFHGETEGQRVLLGTHADIINIDEFDLEKLNGKDKTDS